VSRKISLDGISSWLMTSSWNSPGRANSLDDVSAVVLSPTLTFP
jgi:hypothetical protein